VADWVDADDLGVLGQLHRPGDEGDAEEGGVQDGPARYSVPAKVIVGTTADVKHQLWVVS
jgi:hypothetical protein